MGYLGRDELLRIARSMDTNAYGRYLLGIAGEGA
jgi:hypothetical protein